ncbi:hypothetical protein JRQ81_005219 [Phrynocephalus forsythii]|uniref:Uncharacterized protein n=1 Tax=Phrynocephalus forsythii TaxID=171643 RepID=A0A9Q1B5R7_9SAUR|nr:hypothetical protein JRQ81_005219 [Phrynocephalus forsythii]
MCETNFFILLLEYSPGLSAKLSELGNMQNSDYFHGDEEGVMELDHQELGLAEEFSRVQLAGVSQGTLGVARWATVVGFVQPGSCAVTDVIRNDMTNNTRRPTLVLHCKPIFLVELPMLKELSWKKLALDAKQPNSAIRKGVRVQLITGGKNITTFVPNDSFLK